MSKTRVVKNGVIVYRVKDYAKAIALGVAEFQARAQRAADTVALPVGVELDLTPFNLVLSDQPASPGTIQVGAYH